MIKNKDILLPVIIAGGAGSRLWPVSRELYSKQFLSLYDDNSMLQSTLLRLAGLNTCKSLVVCNEKHRFLVTHQLKNINKLLENIILEPVRRNTAPAIALAALKSIMNGDNPLLLVLSADHFIKENLIFHQAVIQGIPYASEGNLVMFGVVPLSPEEGYGYIQRGDYQQGKDIYQVRRFIEKPSKESAENYFSSGEYYWNSGIFLFHAKNYLSDLGKFRPDILSACRKSMELSQEDDIFIKVDRDSFISCPNDSIDYAVIEKNNNAIVIPLYAGWSDIGSWSSVWEINKKDRNKNVIHGDIFLHDTSNCYINTDDKIIAAVGINNLVIVNTRDAILVADKNKVQDVKKVVEFLKDTNRNEYYSHQEHYTSWGYSNELINNDNYIIIRIIVNPGKSFANELHYYRNKNWIVISGVARVTVGNNFSILTENQSIFIPMGFIHNLENLEDAPLELLEIQLGPCLREN